MNKGRLTAILALLLVFGLSGAGFSNPYKEFVSGQKKLGFKPTGRFNKEIFWTINNKYPETISEEVLFKSGKKHLQLLLSAYGIDPAGFQPVKADGKMLVDFLDRYRGKVDQDLAVYACGRGIVEGLRDPECEIILPSVDKDPKASMVPKGYGGLGILIEERDGKVVIIHPFENCPGEKAGLKAGDVVLSVNGESVKGLDLDTVMNRLRGPVGSKAALKLMRGGKPFTLNLQRENVSLNPVTVGTIRQDIGYVKIVFFGEEYPREVYNAVEAFKTKGIGYWVLDLRDNSGGFLNNMIIMGSLFIPSKEPVMYIRRKDSEKATTSVARQNIQWPVVILVNRYTTGSAEVLAATIREQTGAKIVGTTTRGNAAVSELFKLTGGATLKLTVGEMLTGKKKKVHKIGVKPDVILKAADDPAQGDYIIGSLLKMLKK